MLCYGPIVLPTDNELIINMMGLIQIENCMPLMRCKLFPIVLRMVLNIFQGIVSKLANPVF